MKKIITILVFLPLLSLGQGTPQTFVYKSGTTIGKWKVLDIPTSLLNVGTPQGQLLIYLPPAYYQGKKCGIGIWQGGKGENTNLDATQAYSNSLPLMIQNGLIPYSLLPNGDTLQHALVAIHNNFQSSYRAQLSRIIPWILDSLKLSYDSKYVWATGLSEGGAGTWGIFMIDSVLSKRVHYCIPMANGGYDNALYDNTMNGNLLRACRNGVYFWPYIGNQDPGYNTLGFLAYDAFLKANALPGYYSPRVILGGTHSANVWDVPWKSRGFWDSLGAMMYVPPSPVISGPPVRAKILQDAAAIAYPTTSSYLFDSSYSMSGKLLNTQWTVISWPGTNPPKTARTGSGALWVFNLVQGMYAIRLCAFDSATNYVDTAYAYIQVTGPAPCPAPRKVVSLQVPIYGIMIGIPVDAAKIGYDDGSSQ